MPIAIGTRVGPYEILAPLGAGGMGEVYRARDAKLGRDVALKMLVEAFANDTERLARFQREAQVLASLNHPNIAAIYGLEDSVESSRALVMELVEGRTLADRIAEGPIPLDEALPIARQLAEALDAAHELGIIHRDLKPANIKLRPDGTVKVLDFGLAKILDPAADKPSAIDVTYSPTLSLASTRAGMILGTAAYMAPEQARGRAVDKRADVWAFGVVLYEMLTGRAAFAGEDVSDILASVLKFEPDWSRLPPATPPSIRRLLKRCLTKDPKRRLRECGSALVEIDEALNGPDGSAPLAQVADQRSVRSRWRSLLPAIAAVALVAIGGVTAWALLGNRAPEAPPPTRRFTITLPEGAQVPGISGTSLAISRDGRTLAYRLRTGMSTSRLFRRSLDQFEAVAISGTEDTRGAEFSPDGSWLAFAAGDALKKVALANGTAQTIATIPNAIVGSVEWNTADQVVFTTNGGSGFGLMEVPAGGGEAAPVFKPEGRSALQYPQSLPAANAVLFTFGPLDDRELHVVKRDTGEHRTVLRTANGGRVLPTGHLLFVRAGALWAVPFDLQRLEAVGTPVAVVEGIRVDGNGAVHYDVSDEGSLVYVAESASARSKEKSLLFVGRDKRVEPLSLPKRDYVGVQLSPDQTRVVVQIGESDQADIWVGEVARGVLTRVTGEVGFDGNAIWTLDGKSVVFASRREGRWRVHRQAADGTGKAEMLATFDAPHRSVVPRSWSADGKTLVVDVDSDIGVVETGSKSPWTPLIQTSTNEFQAAVSPDGRWIAYRSSDVGVEGVIYIQRFPGLGDRRPVSGVGGSVPTWSRDGRELLYLQGAQGIALMRVSIKAGADGRLDIGTPEVVAEWNYFNIPNATVMRVYDVTSDGRRVLAISRGDNAGASEREQINVVTNWFEELKRLVPIKQ